MRRLAAHTDALSAGTPNVIQAAELARLRDLHEPSPIAHGSLRWALIRRGWVAECPLAPKHFAITILGKQALGRADRRRLAREAHAPRPTHTPAHRETTSAANARRFA